MLNDEWLSVIVFAVAVICTYISNRWWRRTRIAMFEPKRFNYMLSIERAERLRGKSCDADTHRVQEINALKESLAKEESLIGVKQFLMRNAVAFALYMIIRFSLILPMAHLYPNRELVVIPEYYFQGAIQKLFYGDTWADVVDRLANSLLTGAIPDIDVLGFQKIWGRSLGVVGWALLCHGASSAIFGAMDP